MNTEEALLAAIYRDPYELTPRLAYADWLDEFRPSTEDIHNPRAELIRLQAVSQTQELPPSKRESELLVRLARELEDYPCPVCSIRGKDCEEHCPLTGEGKQLLFVRWGDNLLSYPLEAKCGFMDSVYISTLNIAWNPSKPCPTHWAQEVVKRTAVTRFKPDSQAMYPGRMVAERRYHHMVREHDIKHNTSFFWCRETYALVTFPEMGRVVRYSVPDPIFDRLKQNKNWDTPVSHAFYATADEAIDDLATAIGTTVREMTYGDDE